jgi:Flp pilus assembly protein TadG
MKSPLISRPNRDGQHHEHGVTMVLVAVAMIAIIAMAAWSIDLVTLYLAKEEAQRAADAAALTAARVISVSGITGAASPSSDPTDWQSVCGTTGTATLAAQAAGGQNGVGSISPTVITVTYSTVGGTGTGTSDCSGQTAAFAINPLVTVLIQRTALPTFFSRIWGNTGNSVSATATAEVFNPSASENSGTSGAVTPVQPRCVKPWMVPNIDPASPPNSFVNTADGAITSPGISFNQSQSDPVIGETFYLIADCQPGTPCVLATPPQANASGTNFVGGTPPTGIHNLEYLPGEAPASSVAVPACAVSTGYQGAVAGCDQSTQYQCGVSIANASPPNAIDLSENPGGSNGDTADGLACSLTSQSSPPLANQDVLDTSAYPFKITAGAANPYKIASATQITASNSIVSLPIYDSGGTLTFNNNKAYVAIVGFLQVFINSVDSFGNVNVTVLNVAGCGNGTTGTNLPVNGSSPVPVRLITPP